MSVSAKCIAAVLLLFGAATTASAQSYWYNGDYVLKQRGYYGTPYGGGPIWGSGGGDQYGYGPAYSYAKQAPEPLAPPPWSVEKHIGLVLKLPIPEQSTVCGY